MNKHLFLAGIKAVKFSFSLAFFFKLLRATAFKLFYSQYHKDIIKNTILLQIMMVDITKLCFYYAIGRSRGEKSIIG